MAEEPELPAVPAQEPCGPKAVGLRCRTVVPSPCVQPAELQNATPRAATPARASLRDSLEPLRSIDFRRLAPKRGLTAAPEQPQPLPQQQPLLPQRATSCAVPHVQPLQAVPRAASAGAAAMPAMPAVAALPPLAPAPDSALAWVAGFSRLAKALGCAAPSGGLWDPPEATDLLGLLTLELR